MTEEQETPEEAPLLELRDGLPTVVESHEALRATVDAVRSGTGPVAIDAERASGYRYSARAYLVQLRREGAGTALVDPIAFDDLPRCNEAIGDDRVDPARGQPGPALPGRGRAAPDAACSTPSWPAACSATPGSGWPRSSRRSWADGCARSTPRSTGRPGRCPSRGSSTPPSTSRCWSSCATPSRPSSRRPGRAEWARQEFDHLVRSAPGRAAAGPLAAYLRDAPRPRPSRGGRGAGALAGPQRDRRAPRRDPGPDHPGLRDRRGRERPAPRQGRAARAEGVRRPRRGPLLLGLGGGAADRPRAARGPSCRPSGRATRPAATPRLGRPGPAGCRPAARARTDLKDAGRGKLNLPVENLLTPDYVRRLLWEPPDADGADLPDLVADRLAELGARAWQIELDHRRAHRAIVEATA